MRALRRLDADDRGTTLVEMVVGMALMAVFMGMFTGAMLMMSNTVNKVQAITTSSGQVNDAFLRLDRSVRYATAISTPTQSGANNDWNVEFSSNSDTQTTCTQLRVHYSATAKTSQLQQRTWLLGSDGTSYSQLSNWIPLASNITNGTAASTSTDVPFALVTPPSGSTAQSGYQQLSITLIATSGTSTPGTTRSTMTFTAVNSRVAATNTPCQQIAVDGP